MSLNVVSKGKYDHFMLKKFMNKLILVRHLYNMITEPSSLEKLSSLEVQRLISFILLVVELLITLVCLSKFS